MKIKTGTKRQMSLGDYSIDCYLLNDGSKTIGLHSLDKITRQIDYRLDAGYNTVTASKINYSCPVTKVLQNESDIVLVIDLKDFSRIIFQESMRTKDASLIAIVSALVETGIEKIRGR